MDYRTGNFSGWWLVNLVSPFESAVTDWNEWRAERVAAAKSPEGKLALIQTTWLPEGANFDENLATLDHSKTVKATKLTRTDFSGTVIARGYRLWDSNSEAIQNFLGIGTFNFDPEWIIEGVFTPFENDKPVPFEFIKDNGGRRDLAVPGEIVATIDGDEYCFLGFDDDGQIIVPFSDLTNQSETYGTGRFLLVDRILGLSYVVLDFNRAFAPPCAFSPHFNCPLPLPQNRVRVAIRAGEKRPLFKISMK